LLEAEARGRFANIQANRKSFSADASLKNLTRLGRILNDKSLVAMTGLVRAAMMRYCNKKKKKKKRE
jgi:hypothetical protein